MVDCALVMVFLGCGILCYSLLHGYGHALHVLDVELCVVIDFEDCGLRYFIWTSVTYCTEVMLGYDPL